MNAKWECVAFVGLAYGVSWFAWSRTPEPYYERLLWWEVLTNFGPLLAAVTVQLFSRGWRDGVLRMFRVLPVGLPGWGWLVAGLGLPFVVEALATTVSARPTVETP